MLVEKRRCCLSHHEVALIAARIFNDETTASKEATRLGISPSYLSRLIRRAREAGAFTIRVADG